MKTLIRNAITRPAMTGVILILLSACLFTWAAAIKEGYVTRSLTISTNTAEVFFPQNPTKSLRLVSYDVNGDTNTAILTLYSGTMPLTITGIINVTNLVVTANTNVVTNQLAIIQRADDTIFSVTVLFTNQFTNVFIAATNAIPILTNDVLWICTNTAWTLIGSNTLRSAGEALFATQRRSPLSLRVSTSGVNSNRINSATAKYEDNQ
jgi:hypothetical protein